MGYIKPNQPVIFSESVDLCSTDTDYYVQIVDRTDKTQFQIGLTICNGQSQLLPDPNFYDPPQYTLGDNWSIANNVLCKTSGNTITGFSTIYQLDSAGGYYQTTVIVDSIGNGSTFNVYFGSTFVGSINSTGVHVFYGFPTGGTGAQPLIINASNATDTICISSLTVFQILTNYGVTININDVKYTIFPTDDVNYFTFAEDTLTVTIDWNEYAPAGSSCAVICVLDPCYNTNGQNYPPLINNSQFTGGASYWTLGSSWTYGGNAVTGVHSGVVVNDTISQDNVFVNYTSTYSVTVYVTASTGSIKIYFGTALVDTLNGVGTFIVTGTPTDNLSISIEAFTGTTTVDRIRATTILLTDYVCDYTSNQFRIDDYSCACPETLLINACNDENGMGFVFDGSGFSPRLRLQGKLKHSKYGSDRIQEEDSNGTVRPIYYRRRKSKTLVADLLPEYIHDFLSTLSGYDRFYINGVEYVVDDDEYNVSYDDSQDNVGSVSLVVSEKTQLIRNVNCNAIENSCALPQLGDNCEASIPDLNYLLEENGVNQYITLENGELIILNP